MSDSATKTVADRINAETPKETIQRLIHKYNMLANRFTWGVISGTCFADSELETFRVRYNNFADEAYLERLETNIDIIGVTDGQLRAYVSYRARLANATPDWSAIRVAKANKLNDVMKDPTYADLYYKLWRGFKMLALDYSSDGGRVARALFELEDMPLDVLVKDLMDRYTRASKHMKVSTPDRPIAQYRVDSYNHFADEANKPRIEDINQLLNIDDDAIVGFAVYDMTGGMTAYEGNLEKYVMRKRELLAKGLEDPEAKKKLCAIWKEYITAIRDKSAVA